MVFINSLLGMSRPFFHFWAYILVFFGLALESFPLIGAFVPGGIIMLLICGFLARLHFFILWKVILVAIIASISIDFVGYFFGRRVGANFLHRHRKIFLIKKSTIQKIGKVIHGHTGKSMIFGKINPVTRSIAPFVVGNEGVNIVKFSFYSVVGSVLWVTMFVFTGYIFGSSVGVVRHTESYILWTTIILIGGFYAYYLRNIFRELLTKTKNGVKNGLSSKKQY